MIHVIIKTMRVKIIIVIIDEAPTKEECSTIHD